MTTVIKAIVNIAMAGPKEFKGAKIPLRKSLRSALAHRKLADEIIEVIIVLQVSIDYSLGLLDAGTVGGGHSSLLVPVLDPDA